MAITEGVYAYDEFNDSDATPLESHSPIVGGAWSKVAGITAKIQGDLLQVVGNVRYNLGTLSPSPANFAYTERQIVFDQKDSLLKICFGGQTSSDTLGSGWIAVWNLSVGIIEFGFRSSGAWVHKIQTSISDSGSGIHVIRIVGDGPTATAYFDGQGLRFTEIGEDDQLYRTLGFNKSLGDVDILSIWGKNLKEEDFTLFFDTDFGPVGGSSGSSGGGGGSGGSPSGGGGNPSDIPCDPDTTLVINNGQVVSVAPSDPCQWTGLIWWKLACGEIITSPDYAVEAEVYFNTLTDSFMSIGPIARLNEATGAHYWLTIWNDEVALGKKLSAGVDDKLLDFSLQTFIPGTWYKLRLEIEGNILRGYLNDTLVVSAVDTENSITGAGCAGFRMSRSNPATDLRIDNFRVWLNVYRPFFLENPVFLESMSILKDDGMTTDFSIALADSLHGGESLVLSSPTVIHINEGTHFTDQA
ncbi:MAG: hypothetical protein ACREN0_06015, partial [Thermodesulfobacteriota bacterium]